MDFIPLDPVDDNIASFLDSMCTFPFSFAAINNPGDYENENNVPHSSYELMKRGCSIGGGPLSN